MDHTPTEAKDYVYVPLRRDLYNEFVRRHDRWRDVNVAVVVENIVEDFLRDTDGDAFIWSNEEYLESCADEAAEEEYRKRYGASGKGYQWKSLFLPNGTKIRMTYGGADHDAEIRHEQIVYEENTEDPDGKRYSPSSLARTIANGTARNAWRDLYIQRPFDRDWIQADDARKKLSKPFLPSPKGT